VDSTGAQAGDLNGVTITILQMKRREVLRKYWLTEPAVAQLLASTMHINNNKGQLIPSLFFTFDESSYSTKSSITISS
jgi:hypothetical protein